MKLNSKKRRRRKVFTIVGVVVGVVVVAFLVWFLISFFTIDETLDLTETFIMPEFASLNELHNPGAGEYAVAIDGEPVAGNKIGTEGVEPKPTASTAKMILALAVIQKKPFPHGEKGATITIDQEMYNLYNYYISHGGSYTAVMVGEEISEYDALASVLLASSNNMADALAIWAFGSIDEYRNYATKMLEEWGIKNTTIGIDACGFDESTTSTAEDLVVIGQKLMDEPVLAEIVALKNYQVPVAGTISNTNTLLGQNRIVGIKTGYIGDTSGYCLVLGYKEGEHIITVALMGVPTRNQSFDEGLAMVNRMQNLITEKEIIKTAEMIGYYDSWWSGQVKIIASQDLKVLGWKEADIQTELKMDGETGVYTININGTEYTVEVAAEEYVEKPTLGEKVAHVFGWSNNAEIVLEDQSNDDVEITDAEPEMPDTNITTNAVSQNCTIKLGALMLINPNFTVENDFIATRRTELVSISALYGIREGVAGNGDNLLDAEAAEHINDMVKAYEADNPGHTLETRSCFRAYGTNCGRLCAATGASDHHTGLTCDLLDPVYGTSLDTNTFETHVDWQWLRANSYKYGFIDRFPEAWAGGPMSEPLNVDENGTTGLFETWHYRYVGVKNATEIATGKYNDGKYDSLEHYLKARGLVTDLKTGRCD